MNKKELKLNRRSLLLAIAILAFALAGYGMVQMAIKKAVSLVEVPFASSTLLPHKQIKDSDIVFRKIPKAYVEEGVFLTKEEIIGKYVDLQSKIAKGSLFYQDMLMKKEEIAQLPALLLKQNQVAFPLASDLIKSSGTSLVMNQKVDVYVTYTDPKSKKTTVDKLLKNVRIIGLKDRNGLSLEEDKAQRIPSVVILAVDELYVDYMKKASKIAQIDIFAPHVDYGFEDESTLVEDCILLELLRNEGI